MFPVPSVCFPQESNMRRNNNERAHYTAGGYWTSPAYTDAVNDAQFVRTFGMIVGLLGLATPIVLVLSGLMRAATIGIGMAVLGFGKTTFYRILGITVAILGFLMLPLALLVLSLGITGKGLMVLKTLSNEGKGDPDWNETHKRALIGTIASALGFVISMCWVVLLIASVLMGNL